MGDRVRRCRRADGAHRDDPGVSSGALLRWAPADLRCPIGNAEDLFAILRLLKRDVEFVRFPAESHELTRSGSPAHRMMRFEAILDWFARHLHPEEVRTLERLGQS